MVICVLLYFLLWGKEKKKERKESKGLLPACHY